MMRTSSLTARNVSCINYFIKKEIKSVQIKSINIYIGKRLSSINLENAHEKK